MCYLFQVESFAQDDLLNMANEEPGKPTPVYATFKGTRVITGQSVENLSAKHLNFLIIHRFGVLVSSDSTWSDIYYNLLGLDGAQIRFAFDYGITDRLMVGLARNSHLKTYDASLKYKVLNQTKGKGGVPFTLSYNGNLSLMTTEWADPTRNNYFSSRFMYANQILIGKKLNEKVSIQISPTIVHRNLVKFKKDPNTIFAIGFGSSVKITRSTRFNLEYFPRITGRDEANQYDYVAFGFDIETGGHVFQMMLTNGSGMYEQAMITQTTQAFGLYTLRLGFNLSRTFSFDNH